LFPGREVPAFVEPIVVDELGIGPLRPTPRHRIDLVWKDTHCNRDSNVLRGNKTQLVLPIQARRRDRRVGQPIVGDVVEHIVSRQALGLTVKDTRDELVAAYVMVNYPGGQADG
jgi:hypothetical protein